MPLGGGELVAVGQARRRVADSGERPTKGVGHKRARTPRACREAHGTGSEAGQRVRRVRTVSRRSPAQP